MDEMTMDELRSVLREDPEIVKQAGSVRLSPDELVDSFFKGTDAIHKFAESILNFYLPDPTRAEQICKALYGRMVLCLRAMKQLNNAQFFQTVAASARTVLELLVDMSLLQKEGWSNEILDKFEAFSIVTKHRVSKDTVKHYEENLRKGKETKEPSAAMEFLAGQGSDDKAEDLRRKHWPRKNAVKRIKTWTGKPLRNSIDEDLGDWPVHALYYTDYAIMSYYVHGALVGFEGRTDALPRLVFINAHVLAVDCVLAASDIACRLLKIGKAVDVAKALNEIRLIPILAQTVRQLKIFKEQAKA